MAAKPKTKAEIIEKMADDAGISKKQAKAALESLVAQAAKNAKAGFTIPGIGKVSTAVRKARDGRNPITGEKIRIARKSVVKIKVAKALQDAVYPPKK